MTATRTDVYARVTDSIVAELEKGIRPWLKPWNAEHMAGRITRPLRFNGEAYKGINVLMLWASAMTQGFAAPIWLTFNQAKQAGGHVKAGSKSSLVVYADKITKTDTGDDGEESERDIFFMKGYNVFNVEQVAGLPDHFYALAAPQLDPVQRIEAADLFFANTGADIRHGGNSAHYAEQADTVQMPPFEAFKDAESYCSTLAHELTHWTKHPTRLDRDFGRKRFGDDGYAREELVAEIGAAFLCCDLGIAAEPREDHAAYLDHWLKVMKEDKRAIFQAAAHAQKAADCRGGPPLPGPPRGHRRGEAHPRRARDALSGGAIPATVPRGSQDTAMSLFPETDDDRPDQAARLAPRLRALADRGVYFGTSSWKYEGWLGSIYSPARYQTRGKHSKAKFERECLAEYARTFVTVRSTPSSPRRDRSR